MRRFFKEKRYLHWTIYLLVFFVSFLTLTEWVFSQPVQAPMPLGSIRVQVTLEDFGNPFTGLMLNNISVKLERVNPPGLPQEAITDLKGIAVFNNLPPGVYRLIISKNGYRTQIVQVNLKPGETKFIMVTLEAVVKKNPIIGRRTVGNFYNPAEDKVYVAYARKSNLPPGVPDVGGELTERSAILHGWNPLEEEWKMEKYIKHARADQRLLLFAVNGLAVLSLPNDGKVKAAVPLQEYKPYLIYAHPNFKKLYVLDMTGKFLSISVSDDHKILNQFSLGANALPTDIKYFGGKLYITAMTPDPEIILVDASRDIPIKSVKLPPMSNGVMGQVFGIDVAYDGSKVFVSYGTSTQGELLILDPHSLRVVSRVKVGAQPMGVVSPDGRRVYVANYSDNSVSVVDAWRSREVGRIHTGINPSRILLHPSIRYIYVSNRGSSSVSIIDVFTNRILANIQVGNGPTWMDCTPDGRRIYVVNTSSKNVSVIDGRRNVVIANSPENPFSTPYSVAVLKN